MAKNNALFQINRHFGYGGFIHHFKNLVLRQETGYSDAAQASMEKTKLAIKEYEALVDVDLELALIGQFKQTVDLYEKKLISVQSAIKANKQNIHKLDEEVRVDDALATTALEILS